MGSLVLTNVPIVNDPTSVLAILLLVLGALFWLDNNPRSAKLFRIVPLLVFCYFVPTLLSNVGVIPLESPLYAYIKRWLLPASLILLTLSVDVPAIARLGKPAIVLFLAATAGIMVGGPLSYLLLGSFLPVELGDSAWKGLAALSGSWIGGGANMIAIKESVGLDDATFSMMLVVDIAAGELWMVVLLYVAGREHEIDARIGANRRRLDEVRRKVEAFQKHARPSSLVDLLLIGFVAFGGVALAHRLSFLLPELGSVVKRFTWVAILVTTFGLLASQTRLRQLETVGAGKVGSLFLYLLIASIGAGVQFARIFQAPMLAAIGLLWITVHAVVLLLVRRWIKAPIFFAAVGSRANIGGAASAPIVAAAFHPALAPVGILLGIAGYVLGTYCGLISALLFELVYGLLNSI